MVGRGTERVSLLFLQGFRIPKVERELPLFLPGNLFEGKSPPGCQDSLQVWGCVPCKHRSKGRERGAKGLRKALDAPPACF